MNLLVAWVVVKLKCANQLLLPNKKKQRSNGHSNEKQSWRLAVEFDVSAAKKDFKPKTISTQNMSQSVVNK